MFSTASEKIQGSRRLDQVIWDPKGSDRFIVGGGTDVKMYEWLPDDGKLQLITVQTDLQYMKALAWSPSSVFHDLVAVGLSSGTVQLMRILPANNSPLDKRNQIESAKMATLVPRHSRSCHALAFSPLDPNYLAVGLDRVRNECSLLIWDIERSSQSLSSIAGNQALGARPNLLPPRGVASLRGDPVPVQIYAASEIVNSVSFVPSAHGMLLAGMSSKYVRLYDLRESGPQNGFVQVWNTKCVHGLCFDPFDHNVFAGFGDDSSIRVWDRRKPTDPVLHLTEADIKDGSRNRSISSISWSPTHKGLLVSLGRDSSFLRLWNIAANERLQEEHSHSSDGGKSDRPRGNSVSSSVWSTNNSGLQLNPPVLVGTRKSAPYTFAITSFAFAPHGSPRNSAPHVVALSKEGRSLSIRPLASFCHHAWGARGHLAIASNSSIKVYHSDAPSPGNGGQKPGRETLHTIETRPTTNGNRNESRRRSSRPLSRISTRAHLLPTVLVPRSDSPASLRRLHSSRSRSSPTRDTDGTATPRPILRPLPSSSSVATETELVTPVDAPPQSVKARDMVPETSRRRGRSSGNISRVLEADPSLVMASRARQGYGLESARDNARIVSEEPDGSSEHLRDLWLWMEDHHSALVGDSSDHHLRMFGFDFAVQGVMGLWDGFETVLTADGDSSSSLSGRDSAFHPSRRTVSPNNTAHGNFDEAVAELVGRLDRKHLSYLVPSKYSNRRRLALSLCGWHLSDEELFHALLQWEEEGLHSKAACWALFTHNVERAVDILARSGDERSRAFSAAVAGFDDQRDKDTEGTKDPRIQRWRDQCEKLIVRTDDPYLRTLLQYMVTDGWLDVLDEQSLPLTDRLGIAFMFLRDDQISPWLHRLSKDKIRTGEIDGLLITGLTSPGVDLLQAYVDSHGDVQTAAILGTLSSPSLRSDQRMECWVEAYHDLLDRWKLFHERCQFDIERGRLIQQAIEEHQLEPYEWVERQVMVRCHFCGKIINTASPVALGQPTSDRILMNHCPSCRSELPNCSICLMPVSMPSDFIRDAALRQDGQIRDTLDCAMVFCMTCRHGGHAAHILDWFHGMGTPEGQAHSVCPVAGCACRCADPKLD